MQRLAGTTWGASTQMLRISTEALVFSSTEYCAPVPTSTNWTLPLTPPYGLSPDAYEPLQPTICPSSEESPLRRSDEKAQKGTGD